MEIKRWVSPTYTQKEKTVNGWKTISNLKNQIDETVNILHEEIVQDGDELENAAKKVFEANLKLTKTLRTAIGYAVTEFSAD